MYVSKIEFRNFRCFNRSSFPLRPFTVLVGPNNSGKSTLIEGLKLVSIVAQRAGAANYALPDEELGLDEVDRGITPSLEGIDFQEPNLTFRYAEPPARVAATFSNGAKIRLHLGRDRYVFASLYDASGAAVTNKSGARELGLPGFWVFDNGAPLEETETVRDEKYVRKSQLTRLAPRHFRNQLVLWDQHFPRFQEIAREWNNVRVDPPKKEYTSEGMQLFLDVTERRFTAEASWMGSGLQLWLQTAWLLARARDGDIVVLDEPETYMHPDMQRRLMSLLRRGDYGQVVVSTHSAEIISDARPPELLPVSKRAGSADFASSIPDAQRMIDRVGSRYNLELTRLVGSRRLLLLEGDDDKQYLTLMFSTLFPDADQQLDMIPWLPTGGWDGFESAVTFAGALCDQQRNMRVYCLLDHDHHLDEEITKRRELAEKRGIGLHVWGHKEIENYLVVAPAIARLISGRCSGTATGAVDVLPEEVELWLNEESDRLKDTTFDLISASWARQNKGKSQLANKHARKVVDSHWQDLNSRLRIVPGKLLLCALSSRIHDEFGRGVSGAELARTLTPSEIAPEVRHVLRVIGSGAALQAR